MESIRNCENRIVKAGIAFLTFRSESSFPARANSSVVFPELGGPKSNVILQNPDHIIENLSLEI